MGVLVVWAASYKSLDELRLVFRGRLQGAELGFDVIRCGSVRRPALVVRVYSAAPVTVVVRHAASGKSVEANIKPGEEVAVGWFRAAFKFGWPCVGGGGGVL